ncbi:DMT family transporter [Buchnera aphidicola]|uniref:EamA family transporter n=1 Tax=Buchnera aphidicola subsp. Uroleucon sonchi TaxID=118118 RepID=A0A6C1FAU0_BUCUN|nr:DMT family transporter [Buchnera aphidicola]QIE01998.1 EamA family transporter [Buchnera aphidicola (Uroleucon sonchi)]
MSKILVMILFLLVTITWGTTWIAMKIAIETIPPFFATGIRFLSASPLFMFLAYYTKTPLLFPSGKRWFQLIISIFYFSIPFTLMLYGGIYVSASMASLIFSNMPVVVLMISFLYFKKQICLTQKIGILLSLFTLFVILLSELESQCFVQWKGILALLIALCSHAVIYSECQRKCYNISVITFNALPSLLSGILLSIISWFLENPQITNFSNRSILAVFYLGNFSGIFGILAYFYLQKKISALYSSTVFLIFPIISIFLENYLDKQTISLCKIWFIFPLFLGILLTLIQFNYQKIQKLRFDE